MTILFPEKILDVAENALLNYFILKYKCCIVDL